MQNSNYKIVKSFEFILIIFYIILVLIKIINVQYNI